MEPDPQQKEVPSEESQQKESSQTESEKKDPETMSEGERMGLSKQQLRKLEKKLNAKKKQEKKEEQTEKDQKKDLKKKKEENKIEVSPQYLAEIESQKIPHSPNTKLPQKGESNILVTSALPYVNNVPHLGNIIGCVLSADVYARYKRLQGSNVLYICGTDEYGTATEVKALEQKQTPKEICDHYFQIHKKVYEWFDISFDHFGRTSTEWHSKICQKIFLDIKEAGYISQQTMTQCFCENCDLPLADRFIRGICPTCGFEDARGDQCDKCQRLFDSPTEMEEYFCLVCKKRPALKETTHFCLQLQQIQPKVADWISKSSKEGKWSHNSIQITNSWLNMGLRSKCITRDLKWGVPVPVEGFEKKVFYVWFDAPIGYVSITANLLQEDYQAWWQSPKDVQLYQFMGKDNVPFHTVIFPSALLATSKPWVLIHHISTTQYLNYQNGKFSKRNGTGVFGDNAMTTGIPSEIWRYYLLCNRPQTKDSEFSWKNFVEKNNNELVANLGNLVQRALKYCFSRLEGKAPMLNGDLEEEELNFIELTGKKYGRYKELLDQVEIKKGIELIMEISSIGNKFLQDSKFWEQKSIDSGRTVRALCIICNHIRLLSFLLEPYMPSTSAKINFFLGCEKDQRNAKLGTHLNEKPFSKEFLSLTSNSKGLREPVPLFKEYSNEQIELWRDQFKGKQVEQQKAK